MMPSLILVGKYECHLCKIAVLFVCTFLTLRSQNPPTPPPTPADPAKKDFHTPIESLNSSASISVLSGHRCFRQGMVAHPSFEI